MHWKKYSGDGDLSEDREGSLNHSRSERKYFKSEMTQEESDKIKKLKATQKKHEL